MNECREIVESLGKGRSPSQNMKWGSGSVQNGPKCPHRSKRLIDRQRILSEFPPPSFEVEVNVGVVVVLLVFVIPVVVLVACYRTPGLERRAGDHSCRRPGESGKTATTTANHHANKQSLEASAAKHGVLGSTKMPKVDIKPSSKQRSAMAAIQWGHVLRRRTETSRELLSRNARLVG